jgi:hypothetical protein
MLRLNPDDNQGIRYILIDALLMLGRDADAASLLKQYKYDGAAAWLWSAALLSFRQTGDSGASRRTLARAVEANPHVPAYLFGRKVLPRTLPAYIGIGDDDEAIAYVHDARAAWNAAKGAKAWAQTIVTNGPKPVPPPVDAAQDAERERVDNATLALLYLGLHNGDRAWKGFDWGVLDRLHEKGLISDPAGKAKSVFFTETGLETARNLFQTLFVNGANSGS